MLEVGDGIGHWAHSGIRLRSTSESGPVGAGRGSSSLVEAASRARVPEGRQGSQHPSRRCTCPVCKRFSEYYLSSHCCRSFLQGCLERIASTAIS